MKVALIGAELEENLGLRYMAAALEQQGHEALIIPFNEERDIPGVVEKVLAAAPQIAGLSMVFTGRAREFCRLAAKLREGGFSGHLTAGGHFAALNCRQLLEDFPEFDSIALGEGEELICALAAGLEQLPELPGFCCRAADGGIRSNPGRGNPENLDALPFPRRDEFHEYFGRRIAGILSSRGCWRDCAFCSIDAWYRSGGGRKFRIRSIDNIVAEMSQLYHGHGIRIFNFQDDNFFLPDSRQALTRFKALRAGLRSAGVDGIAIAVKARPDSITRAALDVLDDLGIFRVFLGVENASQRGLDNLNRNNTVAQIESALKILNDFDLHVAYNLLLFEPDTSMQDLAINLDFIERHGDNPFNFCRAEAYAATGLEQKLRADNILSGDYFGFDYRIKDPRVETFHRLANYAFFDRNFSDYGLQYFTMEVDFSYLLLRRFFPDRLNRELRAEVRGFIKETNIDTHRHLCRIYDLVQTLDPEDAQGVKEAMKSLRRRVDERSRLLRFQGERILDRLQAAHAGQPLPESPAADDGRPGQEAMGLNGLAEGGAWTTLDPHNPFGLLRKPIPYDLFKRRLAKGG